MPYTTKHKQHEPIATRPFNEVNYSYMQPKKQKNTKIKAEVCGGMHGGLKN